MPKSDAGKGSTQRPVDYKKWDKNYDDIFRKDTKHKPTNETKPTNKSK